VVGGHLYSGACLSRKPCDLVFDLLGLYLFDFLENLLLTLFGGHVNEVTYRVRVNGRRHPGLVLILQLLLLLLMYLAQIALDHVHVELGIIVVLLPRLDRHHSKKPGVSIDREYGVRVVRHRLVVKPRCLKACHHRRAEVWLPGRHQ
jgi:hypothetical protein